MSAADEVFRWASEPPLSTRRWRTALARVRTAIRVAKRAQGRERRHALVRACRLLTRVDPPKAREFGPAAWALEIELSKLTGECIGCLAMAPLPEDPPIRIRGPLRVEMTSAQRHAERDILERVRPAVAKLNARIHAARKGWQTRRRRQRGSAR